MISSSLSRRTLALMTLSAVARAQPAGDMPYVDAFGPVGGDDDAPTFAAALRSGQPFRLRARRYRLAQPVSNAGAPVVMHGVPGASRLLCGGVERGSWFRLETKETIDIDGVIWDGDGKRCGSDVGMVTIAGDPVSCAIRRSAFLNGSNSAGLLILVAAAGLDHTMLLLDEVTAARNVGCGIWVEHGANLLFSALRLYENKAAGLQCRRFDNRAGAPIRRLVVRDSFAWRNGQAGFSVGGYNEAPAGAPLVLGPGLADSVDVTFQNLFAWENQGYGINADGHNVRVIGCRTARNGPSGGIDANARNAVIQGCEVTDERGFGIDTGGCDEVEISDNRVANVAGAGLNAGGSRNVRGRNNRISGCTGPAIAVWNTEIGGGGVFPYRVQRMRFEATAIDMSALTAGAAIMVRDGAEDVVFDGLDVVSSALAGRPAPGPDRVLYAATGSIEVSRVRFNGEGRFAVTPQSGVLVVPDVAERVVLPAGQQTVSQVRTASQARVGDGIGWIEVLDGGRGYRPGESTATLEGDGDVAAVGKLEPNIWTGGGGQLVGFRLGAPGKGFRRATVRLGGPGSGARLAVHIGVPIPLERRLVLIFPGGGRLVAPLPVATIAPGGSVELYELARTWQVAGRG